MASEIFSRQNLVSLLQMFSYPCLEKISDAIFVHGVDLSEDAIKSAINFARHKDLNCEFKVGDAHDLPYPDEYFDKIVCSSSLEHFTDDIKALKEMHRVLKSNGRVFLTTDSFNYPISKELKEKHKKLAHVVNYYSKKELKKSIGKCGIQNETEQISP